MKYFQKIRIEASGTISVAVKCWTNATTQVGSTTTVTGDSWLPANFIGDYLTIEATSSDGTGIVYGITVDSEVLG